MRCELSDYEWFAIKPMLPNKSRGVPRVNDRRVLNGIFWVLRSGAPWLDLGRKLQPVTCQTVSNSLSVLALPTPKGVGWGLATN
jgi:transposase